MSNSGSEEEEEEEDGVGMEEAGDGSDGREIAAKYKRRWKDVIMWFFIIDVVMTPFGGGDCLEFIS